MNLYKSIDTKILYLFLLVYLLLAYSSLIFRSDILTYDDSLLLSQFSKFHSLYDYFEFHIDLQPIRDLSFLFDLFLSKEIHFQTYHLTNFLIFISILYLLKKISDYLFSDPFIVFFLIAIFAISPVTTSSVAWISARKHLLSLLFILVATHSYLKMKAPSFKSEIQIIFFYSLACLSQPINVLWPIWMLFDSKTNKKINLSKNIVISLIIVMILCLSSNFYYYNNIYTHQFHYDKLTNLGILESLSRGCLSLGRYFYQTIFQFSALPTPHNFKSIQNPIGLGLLVIYLIFIFFSKKKSPHINSINSCLCYFILGLTIVLFNTNIFNSDTYLLNAQLGIYVSFLIFVRHFFKNSFVQFFAIFYLLILAIYNFTYIPIFKSDIKLFTYSFEKEAEPTTAAYLANLKLENKQFDQANALLEFVEREKPDYSRLTLLKGTSIFNDQRISNEVKISKLESLKDKKASSFYFLSVLYTLKNNQSEAIKNLNLIFKNIDWIKIEYPEKEYELFEKIEKLCVLNKLDKCLQQKLRL
jgi:hypothetical protein